MSQQPRSDAAEATAAHAHAGTPCALCGSREARRLFPARDRLHGVPGDFWVVRCRRCSLARTEPRPSGAALAAYYPDDYGPHATAEEPPPEAPRPRGGWFGRLRRLASRRIWWTPDLPPGARVLELGSGAGHFVRHALGRGWDVHALEPAEKPAQRLARDPRVSVHRGPAESLAVPAGTFDAVFAWMVVEHLEDPSAVVRAIRRALRPGGYFVFSVPNAGCWEFDAFRTYWYGVDVPRHLWHWSPRTLRRLLEASGFSVERIHHQKVLKNITGSLGLVGAAHPSLARTCDVLARALSGPLVTFAVGAALAALRQGGRLTVVARAR